MNYVNEQLDSTRTKLLKKNLFLSQQKENRITVVAGNDFGGWAPAERKSIYEQAHKQTFTEVENVEKNWFLNKEDLDETFTDRVQAEEVPMSFVSSSGLMGSWWWKCKCIS